MLDPLSSDGVEMLQYMSLFMEHSTPFRYNIIIFILFLFLVDWGRYLLMVGVVKRWGQTPNTVLVRSSFLLFVLLLRKRITLQPFLG